MEMLSALLAICWGSPTIFGGPPSLRANTADPGVFIDGNLNKMLNIHASGQWLKRSKSEAYTMF